MIVKRFTSDKCTPCRQLIPIFEELKKEIPEVLFQTINVDINREETTNNGVNSVPTIILEKDGIQVYRFSGVLPKSVIVGIIKKYL